MKLRGEKRFLNFTEKSTKKFLTLSSLLYFNSSTISCPDNIEKEEK